MVWIVGTNWTRTKPGSPWRTPRQLSNDASNTFNVLLPMMRSTRLGQGDLAKAARDKKKADMAKRQPSSKETKADIDAVASNKALAAAAAAASDSDYSTCHVSLHGSHFTPSSTPTLLCKQCLIKR